MDGPEVGAQEKRLNGSLDGGQEVSILVVLSDPQISDRIISRNILC